MVLVLSNLSEDMRTMLPTVRHHNLGQPALDSGPQRLHPHSAAYSVYLRLL
jgi:hypothetical protein